jgi:hypothetical protein
VPILSTIFGRLRSLFGGGASTAGSGIAPPDVTQVAAAAAPLRVGYTGRAGLGGEELEQTDVDLFLRGELVQFADSSWIRYSRYYPERQELEIGLLNGKSCHGLVASQVPPELALRWAQAASKGSLWWQEFFVAGKGAGRGMNRKTHRPIRWLAWAAVAISLWQAAAIMAA